MIFKTAKLDISKIKENKGQIEGLPANPRTIKDAKFKALVNSIEENPEMLGLREILVTHLKITILLLAETCD